MLFHARGRQPCSDLLDVTSNDDRIEAKESQAACFSPSAELPHGLSVGGPCVRVADVGREILDEPPHGVRAGIGNQRGKTATGKRQRNR